MHGGFLAMTYHMQTNFNFGPSPMNFGFNPGGWGQFNMGLSQLFGPPCFQMGFNQGFQSPAFGMFQHMGQSMNYGGYGNFAQQQMPQFPGYQFPPMQPQGPPNYYPNHQAQPHHQLQDFQSFNRYHGSPSGVHPNASPYGDRRATDYTDQILQQQQNQWLGQVRNSSPAEKKVLREINAQVEARAAEMRQRGETVSSGQKQLWTAQGIMDLSSQGKGGFNDGLVRDTGRYLDTMHASNQGHADAFTKWGHPLPSELRPYADQSIYNSHPRRDPYGGPPPRSALGTPNFSNLPSFGNAIPGSGNAIPGSGNAIPGSGNAIPGSGNAIPGSGNAIPGSGNAIPGSGNAIPGSGNAIPGSGNAIPGSGNAIPGSGNAIPGSGNAIPGSGNAVPGSGNAIPGSGNAVPGSGNAVPGSGNAVPGSGNAVPGSGNAVPGSGNAVPGSGNAVPGSGNAVPGSGNAVPGSGNAVPGSGNAVPGSGNAVPGSGNAVPGSGNAVPGSGNAVPGSGNAVPGSGNAVPGSGNAVPGSGNAVPGSGNAVPGSGNAVPNSGNAVPNSGNAVPNSGNAVPNSGNAVPNSGNAVPNSGNAVPNSGNAVPNSGNAVPNSGNAVPNSGNAVPNSGNAVPNSGNAVPNSGNAVPNSGNAVPNSGNATPNSGNATPNSGNATPNSGNSTPTTGNATPNTGNATPNTGNSTPTFGTANPTPTATPTPVAPQNPADMEIGGVKVGDMRGSNGLGAYDNVVKSQYGPDAFIVDRQGQDGNAAGRMDAKDLIRFKDPQSGEWKTKEVGSEMREIQFRTSAVQSTRDFEANRKSGKIQFEGNIANQKYNTEYWQQTTIDGKKMWRVKEGVNAADAINDVFSKDSNGGYRLDCAASANMVLMKAKLDTMGADDFNNQFKSTHVAGWATSSRPPEGGDATFDTNGGIDRMSGSRTEKGNVKDLRPGDFAYFDSGRASTYGNSASQGENSIYLGMENGKAVFWGNPIGEIRTDPNDPSCAYGKLSSLTGRPDANQLAREDQNRETSYAPPAA
jgi:Protein-glutamine gamma-glutamyltransferase/Grass antifreeze beta roll